MVAEEMDATEVSFNRIVSSGARITLISEGASPVFANSSLISGARVLDARYADGTWTFLVQLGTDDDEPASAMRFWTTQPEAVSHGNYSAPVLLADGTRTKDRLVIRTRLSDDEKKAIL